MTNGLVSTSGSEYPPASLPSGKKNVCSLDSFGNSHGFCNTGCINIHKCIQINDPDAPLLLELLFLNQLKILCLLSYFVHISKAIDTELKLLFLALAR